MVDIAITIREDVTAAMNRMAASGADMTTPMKDIAGHLADTTRERFETETDPTGKKWKPSQRVIEHGGKTLTLSGDLSNSITEDWGKDFAAAGPERSGGAGVYALIHQTGGVIRPREKKALSFGGRIVAKVIIPARPYVGFNDVNANYVIGALARHLGFGAV